MPDHSQQAENLRQAMRDAGVQTPEYNADAMQGNRHPFPTGPHGYIWSPTTGPIRPAYLWKDGVWRTEPEPILAGHVDKAKLWDDFKALMEVEAQGKAGSQSLDYRTIGGFGPKKARAVLDRMEQAETFARVRAEFKSTEGGS